MGVAAVIGLIGTAASVAGTIVSANAQAKMVAEQTEASKKAENARQQQMQMDAQHRRRQSVRESIMARAMSLAVGVSQGAQEGSGVQAAMGGATAMGLENQQATTAAETLGGRVFAANRQYADATARGQRGMALGAGLSAIGGALVSNAGTIGQIGTFFGGGGQLASPTQPYSNRVPNSYFSSNPGLY